MRVFENNVGDTVFGIQPLTLVVIMLSTLIVIFKGLAFSLKPTSTLSIVINTKYHYYMKNKIVNIS